MFRCTVSHQQRSVVEGGTVVPPVAGSAPSAHKVITWLPWPHFVPPSQILNPFLPQPSVLTDRNTCTFKLVVMIQACLSYLARIHKQTSTHKALGLWRQYDVTSYDHEIGQWTILVLTCMMLGSGGGHRTGWSRSTGSEGCSTASKLSNGGTPWSAAAGLILLLPTLSSCTAPRFIQISSTVLAIIPLVSSDIAQLRNFVCRRCMDEERWISIVTGHW